MASYPSASYRTNTNASRWRGDTGGFQKPVSQPANDNRPWRPPPVPANDNVPDSRPNNDASRYAKRLVPIAIRAGGALKLFRVHPAVNAALTAYDLWKLWNMIQTVPGHYYPQRGSTWKVKYCPSPGTGTQYRRDSLAALTCAPAVITPSDNYIPSSANHYLWEYVKPYFPPNVEAVMIEHWAWTPSATLRAPVYKPRTVAATVPGPVPGRPLPRPIWVNPVPPPGVDIIPQPVPYAAIPYRLPVTELPESRVASRPTLRVSPRRPPPARTKERKVEPKIGGLMLAIQKGMHTFTEVDDAVGAIHDALPEKYQSKSKLVNKRLEALYRHWDKLDINKALYNLAFNHISDLIVGRIAGGAQDFATKQGITLGRTGIGIYGL